MSRSISDSLLDFEIMRVDCGFKEITDCCFFFHFASEKCSVIKGNILASIPF